MIQNETLLAHVTGRTIFTADVPLTQKCLLGHVVTSPYAHALIRKIDVTEAMKVPGVAAVLTAKDIPGKNDMGAAEADEPVLADGEVSCIGQAVALIAACDKATALEAEKRLYIEYEELPAVLSIEEAKRQGDSVVEPMHIASGDYFAAMEKAPITLSGTLRMGGQEHLYLETQCAVATPINRGGVHLLVSSQNPSSNQMVVSKMLGIAAHKVNVEVDHLGGGFGGKETQGAWCACWSALLALHCHLAVKVLLTRREDMSMTGKRHPAVANYKVGFDKSGRLLALLIRYDFDAGCTADLSAGILSRCLMHSDNAYNIPNTRFETIGWRTNHPSNTAFRGFGAPQAIAAVEEVVDRVARHLGLDGAQVRLKNYYSGRGMFTPYGEKCPNMELTKIHRKLLESSSYAARKEEIKHYNTTHEHTKKGMALVPVKFGISFTTGFLNQAGALIHIYRDGSIQVNHGGVEMGQGLNEKTAIVVADLFSIPSERVTVTNTDTSKVPNTSPTAASTGTDLNGMAVLAAAKKLKRRLSDVASDYFKCNSGDLKWENSMISYRSKRLHFTELVTKAYLGTVSLSATGYYATPGIFFDEATGKGSPFHYFVCGAAISEVTLDCLTGEVTIDRTDILHDCGKSINEAIDKGQIEGAFVQGMGWCTMEELRYAPSGRLLTDSPDTYKIPTIRTIPRIFNVNLFEGGTSVDTIGHSKAVGEPPLIFGLSVWFAIKEAMAASMNLPPVKADEALASLPVPATPEAILLLLMNTRQ